MVVGVKLTGKIKFWIDKKGYGFIENGYKQDIFIDGWDIKDGTTPKQGDVYEFEAEAAEKGIRARKASLVKKPSEGRAQQKRFTGPMDHNY